MSTVPVSKQNFGVVPRVAYSPAEFAEALGVSRQHVHNMIGRGELQSMKLGKARRIPATEIERLLDEASASTRVVTTDQYGGVA